MRGEIKKKSRNQQEIEFSYWTQKNKNGEMNE